MVNGYEIMSVVRLSPLPGPHPLLPDHRGGQRGQHPRGARGGDEQDHEEQHQHPHPQPCCESNIIIIHSKFLSVPISSICYLMRCDQSGTKYRYHRSLL